MALFRDDKTGGDFDDGVNALPGEAEFTRDHAEQHFKHKQFSYVGTPDYVSPQIAIDEKFESDRKAAEAVAEAAEVEKRAAIAEAEAIESKKP